MVCVEIAMEFWAVRVTVTPMVIGEDENEYMFPWWCAPLTDGLLAACYHCARHGHGHGATDLGWPQDSGYEHAVMHGRIKAEGGGRGQKVGCTEWRAEGGGWREAAWGAGRREYGRR